MTDPLVEVLRAEGLTIEAIERVREAWAKQGLFLSEGVLAFRERQRREEQERRDASRSAALALAIPYAGRIKDCQASVYPPGRGMTAHRCNKRARFAVRREEHDKPEERGDGRMVACSTHAGDHQSSRYRKHWDYERTASEVVEPEYQPPLDK